MSDNGEKIVIPPLVLIEREGDQFKISLGSLDLPSLLLAHKYFEMQINAIILKNMQEQQSRIVQATSIIDRMRKGISPNGR